MILCFISGISLVVHSPAMSPLGSPRLMAICGPIVHHHEATVLLSCLHMRA